MPSERGYVVLRPDGQVSELFTATGGKKVLYYEAPDFPIAEGFRIVPATLTWEDEKAEANARLSAAASEEGE